MATPELKYNSTLSIFYAVYQWDGQELLKEHGHLQVESSEPLAEREMENDPRLFAHRKGQKL